MALLSRTACVVALWMASLRWFATFSWTLATLSFCFFQLADPFLRRDSLRCSRLSFFSAFLRCLPFGTLSPSERTMRSLMPTSMPSMSLSPSGISGSGTSVQQIET